MFKQDEAFFEIRNTTALVSCPDLSCLTTFQRLFFHIKGGATVAADTGLEYVI